VAGKRAKSFDRDLGLPPAHAPGMSEGINQVMLMGNLGANAELKATANGSILKFSLATTRVWFEKETNNKKEETVWHRVTVFGRRADALEKYLTRGTRVFVKGRIHTSSYEKDGQKRFSTEIICEDLVFAGGGDRASTRLPGVDGLAEIAAPPPPSATNGGYSRRPAAQEAFDTPTF
jgi:single-strand DNA-binding protein